MSSTQRILALATGNAHKLKEFGEILAPCGWEVRSLREWLPSIPEPEETEPDFQGNALLKARFAWEHLRGLEASRWPHALAADDSGLAVARLGGAPGVHSARFAQRAGAGSGDEANRRELVRCLAREGLGEHELADAAFVCAIAWMELPAGRALTVEGRCHGAVALREQGEGGFGYDCLFHPRLADRSISGATFAQIPSEDKHALSHRGEALRALVAALGV